MSRKCVSYYRTSSLTNTGDEKDSLKRQKSVVHRFCKNHGYEIVGEFYETMSGDNEILTRPKFVEMLDFCDSQDVKTIVFENTTRFSRDLICMETVYEYLKGLGFTLISSESPESFVDDSPTSVRMPRIHIPMLRVILPYLLIVPVLFIGWFFPQLEFILVPLM